MKNHQNEVTSNVTVPGRKLDLPTIADAIAMETNGFISKDLYDALKLAESKGLCAEDKPLPEIILWEDRKLNYDTEKLSKEADCVLLLRAKCGDENAFNKLFENKKPILCSLAKKETTRYAHCDTILENDYESYEQKVNEAFYFHVMDYPICFHGNVNFSHSNLKYKILDYINKKIDTSSQYTNFGKCGYNANRFKKKMEANDVDVKNLSYEQYESLCVEQGYTSDMAKTMFEAHTFMYDDSIDRYSSKRRGVDELDGVTDFSLNKTNGSCIYNIDNISTSSSNGFYIGDKKYKSFNPANNEYELSPLKAFLDKCRHDKKHGRDVETFITHETGEFGFDLSNIYAENAPDSPSREETAKLMGYENSYEVKKALKRAREFILSKMKKEAPALYAEIVAGIVG